MDLGFLTSLNLIFYVILGIAILAGFLRGFKKSLFTFITMAIFYVVFFLTINQAVNILWNANLSFLGSYLSSVDASLANFTSFSASYESIIQVALGDTIDLSGVSSEFLDLAMGLMLFALKIVWTILYFTVILLLYKILCLIIRVIFFKSKEGAAKNRGMGAVIGVLNGAMAVFVTLIMLGGIMSFTESAVTLLQETSQTPETLNFVPRNDLYQASNSVLVEAENDELDGMIADLEATVEEFNNNIFVQLANSITTPSVIDENVEVPLHIDLFDKVLSFDYNDETIAFRYELAVFSNAAAVILSSDYYETQDITAITGDEIRTVFASLSESKLVVSLIPLGIELAAEHFDKTDLVDVDKLYDGTIDFEQELATLGSIAGALFDILNGAGFIGGEGSVDQVEITPQNVRDLFSDISGSDVIVMITETLLLPMLEDGEGNLSTIITVPADLDLEAEFLALGEIFAEIVEADIDFSELADADVSVLLNAVGQIDLTVLLDSQLVTEALINILSGEAEIEGLDMLSIPSGINWRDQGGTDGELRLILEALNAFIDIAGEVDFENLDINIIIDLDETEIQTFFASYIIRATVSDIINTLELGDTPLIFPDNVYDAQGYFTEYELKALVSAIKLILDDSATETSFDIFQVLSLTDTELDTLLGSDIIYATIGDFIYDMNTDILVVPQSVVTTVTVDSASVNVINKTELKAIFSALTILDITDFDSITFDAGIINTLENATEDDIDEVKINGLLDSDIIHATVSDMIIELGVDNGGILVVPDDSVDGTDIIYQNGLVDFVASQEIIDILRALYSLDISNFDNIDLEDTSLLISKLSVLLESSIIHATVSDIILDLGSAITLPEEDILNNDVIIQQGTITYIDSLELENLLNSLELLGVTNPSTFTNLTFSNLDTDTKRTELLKSAILHATISEQLLGLGSSLLTVPQQDEAGNPLIFARGTGIYAVDFVETEEVKAIIAAMIAMGFGDVDDLTTAITAQTFIDNMDLVLDSASLQATVSNIILVDAATSIIVPDLDASSADLRIAYSDVTFIQAAELENFFTSVNALGIVDLDFTSFSASLDDFDSVDFNVFFNSYIMQATVSDSFLAAAGDETAAAGTTQLLVPTTKTIAITVDSLNSELIEKAELINLINAFNAIGIGDYSDALDAGDINNLTEAQLDVILLSDSMHITIDNMLRGNPAINTDIPALAEDNTTYTITVTVKSEIKDFIIATQQFAGVDFTSVSFNVAAITGLTPGQRDVVLDSMIVRNILTDELEATMTADDPLDLYWPANSDYEQNNPALFLKEAGINAVLSHYGLI